MYNSFIAATLYYCLIYYRKFQIETSQREKVQILKVGTEVLPISDE